MWAVMPGHALNLKLLEQYPWLKDNIEGKSDETIIICLAENNP